MSGDNYKVRDVQPTVLRLNPELRARLVKDAKAHGRSLSKEIEVLLQLALASDGYASVASGGLRVSEPAPSELSNTEAALLQAFRRLPVDKQLALLSLLK